MKCFFAVEVIDYMSGSLLCSMHMVLVCINIRFFHIARVAPWTETSARHELRNVEQVVWDMAVRNHFEKLIF